MVVGLIAFLLLVAGLMVYSGFLPIGVIFAGLALAIWQGRNKYGISN